MEYWKIIKGYVSRYGNYRVSNLGRVKNGLGADLKPHWHFKGYVMIALMKDGKNKRAQLHRLVAKAFIPNPDNLPQVNHLDGNKKNNAVSNLQWCTNKQNAHHARRTGLVAQVKKGGDNPLAFLTDKQAEEIRNTVIRKGPNAPVTRKDLCEKYGVSIHVIKDVRAGKSYAI